MVRTLYETSKSRSISGDLPFENWIYQLRVSQSLNTKDITKISFITSDHMKFGKVLQNTPVGTCIFQTYHLIGLYVRTQNITIKVVGN